ncbi:MAG: hypothetical protein CVU55_05790 [Deltaproteobacteria bacterium HGW-Deltaproteobacteria-13]|jgi:hypothetical protein|nr:MAG: hypothetical protein CVU55_05790 [Deltaproteobacteria bacterium HGW-Deltaproteobacteria-13]
MKKLIFKILFLTLVILVPASAIAEVSVHINIPLPPPIIFPAPPGLVVIPETNVYAVPDVQDDIFFSAGWWWRPWQGRWYRSHYYDRGWAYYRGTPSFHRSIPPSWRNDYRNNQWRGYRWEHQRVPNQDLQRNWRGWERNRHWQQNSWGVKGLPSGNRNQRDMRQSGPQDRGKGHGDQRSGGNDGRWHEGMEKR